LIPENFYRPLKIFLKLSKAVQRIFDPQPLGQFSSSEGENDCFWGFETCNILYPFEENVRIISVSEKNFNPHQENF
jgi:hypothetical protein